MAQGPMFYLVATSVEFPLIFNISSIFKFFITLTFLKSIALIFSEMFLNLCLLMFLHNWI